VQTIQRDIQQQYQQMGAAQRETHKKADQVSAARSNPRKKTSTLDRLNMEMRSEPCPER
jgi:hypothetical protein